MPSLLELIQSGFASFFCYLNGCSQQAKLDLTLRKRVFERITLTYRLIKNVWFRLGFMGAAF